MYVSPMFFRLRLTRWSMNYTNSYIVSERLNTASYFKPSIKMSSAVKGYLAVWGEAETPAKM